MSAHLARIADVNPHINAVVQMRAEAALADARAADRALASGTSVGPLHGVPITVKDSFDTAGLVSTGGTLGRKGFVPTTDATIVSRLKAAGAIVLGKTNTPELTLAYEANNLIYGMTRNPYDLSRGTGGSSGGSAAIVAAWGSPLDVGSDTAGSIRFPAHCCGVAGLKPTSGRVPRTGHIIGPGGLQQWLTTIGPIARRVADLELALGIMAGPDGVDPHIVPVPLRCVEGRRTSAACARRCSWTRRSRRPRPTCARRSRARHRCWPARASRSSRPRCRSSSVRSSSFPDCSAPTERQASRGSSTFLGTREVSPQVQGAINLMRPHAMSSAALGDLMLAIDQWRTQALAFMQRYDLIVCPAAADVAPLPVTNWNDPAVSWNAGIFPYLVPFNFTGAPSVVVRAGASSAGLPIGVQCVAQPWREDVALRAATEVEAALGGWQPPRLAGR